VESDRRSARRSRDRIAIKGIASRFAGIDTRDGNEAVDRRRRGRRKLCSELVFPRPVGEIGLVTIAFASGSTPTRVASIDALYEAPRNIEVGQRRLRGTAGDPAEPEISTGTAGSMGHGAVVLNEPLSSQIKNLSGLHRVPDQRKP